MFAKIKSWFQDKIHQLKGWWKRRTENGWLEAIRLFGRDVVAGGLLGAAFVEVAEIFAGVAMMGLGSVFVWAFVGGLTVTFAIEMWNHFSMNEEGRKQILDLRKAKDKEIRTLRVAAETEISKATVAAKQAAKAEVEAKNDDKNDEEPEGNFVEVQSLAQA